MRMQGMGAAGGGEGVFGMGGARGGHQAGRQAEGFFCAFCARCLHHGRVRGEGGGDGHKKTAAMHRSPHVCAHCRALYYYHPCAAAVRCSSDDRDSNDTPIPHVLAHCTALHRTARHPPTGRVGARDVDDNVVGVLRQPGQADAVVLQYTVQYSGTAQGQW